MGKHKNNRHKMGETTFIDLFAGIGGFRIALEELGFKCVFSSEWDKYAQKTYFENFKEMPYGDITKLKDEDINKTIPDHDVLCGGFPCQAFSVSGKQKGFEDTRGTLFFDIVRIVKVKNPKILFLENVKNFEKHDNGKTFSKVMAVLDEIGYNAFAKVLNASQYGAPTSRERIYFVCFRKDLNIKKFEFPKPTFEKVYLKDYLENNIDAKEFEINRPDIKFYKEAEQPLQLNPIQIGTINNGGQGERIYSINGHAITLSAHGGGAASKTGAYLINGKVRKLTPKECARVMGFPENFKILVSKAQAYKQFGNSVSIQVLRAVSKRIFETLQSA
ncbi:DNA (cytosine-5-)-methyltransferase [Candidatus Pacearchaeota archaeon]|nr:DNA (cytosine-5-)-methyltransferase [Candidatus Pacearchaeota archaeon]